MDPRPLTDHRARILRAAVEVYSEFGFRGATTRRIAQKAEVNEVTLFRHFGSKASLLREAIECQGFEIHFQHLPDIPAHPREELLDWCGRHMEELRARRSLIRTCMGEIEEHPEILPAGSPTIQAAAVLTEYLRRLQHRGLARADFDPALAAPMLMGILFADAMGRDIMPDLYPGTAANALEQYVTLFLRSIGAAGGDAP